MEYEEDDMDFELLNIAEINSKILKANNELFLQTNRRFFGWRSDVLSKDLVNLTINNIDIRIPYGSFFILALAKILKTLF